MKIYVLGSYYSDNLGDGVICECVKMLLEKTFSAYEVIIWDLLDREGFHTDNSMTYNQVKGFWYRANARSMVSRLGIADKMLLHCERQVDKAREHINRFQPEKGDIVVFAGGQMFMDSYALLLDAYIKKCSDLGVPVILNACGTGPSCSRKIRKQLSQALANPCIKLLSCRDDVRWLNAMLADAGKKAVSTHDPALWAGTLYGIQKAQASDMIGLGIMYGHSVPIAWMVKFWVSVIKKLEKDHVRYKMFVNGGASDIAFMKEVYRRIPGPKRSYEDITAPVPETPAELVQLISGFQGLVSMRLHSIIIASSLGIPSVAVSWDRKLDFFYQKMGMTNRCFGFYNKADTIVGALFQTREQGIDMVKLNECRKKGFLLLKNAVRGLEQNEQNY